MPTKGFGGLPSAKDIRDFAYSIEDYPVQKGGERYKPEDIEDQHKVGICTAISLTQNARKATGKRFNADFQYLLQKKFFDKNWSEGSSARSALSIAKNYGLLPEDEWTHTTEEDRQLPYYKYIKKLQAVPEDEITRLMTIADNYKIEAYARVPVDRDAMARAIDDSKAGIIVRFVVGKEWSTAPIEPLRKPQEVITGHLITSSNFDGGSFRVANTWGTDWADEGTAYHILRDYSPTEAWAVWFPEEVVPPVIDEQQKKKEELEGTLIALMLKYIAALQKKIAELKSRNQ